MTTILSALLPLLLFAPDPIGTASSESSIRIRDAASGCYYSDERTYEWIKTADGFVRGNVILSQADIDSIREQILTAEPNPPDLLAQVGVTPVTLAAHHDEILRALWPDDDDASRRAARVFSEHVDEILAYDSIAPQVLKELTLGESNSTRVAELCVEIPGSPPIVVQSNGTMPWKLAWKIDDGTRRWTSSNLAVTKAIARLADPSGPNAYLLDGTRYWSEGFWGDLMFWMCCVGDVVDELQSREEYERLDGYAQAMERFRIEKAQMSENSLLLEVAVRSESVVDGASWRNPIKDGKPIASWKDFTIGFDAALACVEKQTWLKEWKLAGPDRTIHADVLGRSPSSESAVSRDLRVIPPWKHAHCRGEPDVGIHLYRKHDECATVWLSKDEPGAMIERARPDLNEKHWFDALDFSFHTSTPTYGYVDASGRFELRTMR